MRWAVRMLLVGWLCVVLALGACAPRAAEARIKIALIPKGTTHWFWRAIHAGGRKAAEEHGDAQVIWQGPPKEDMRQQQQDIVERFTSEGVNALVLAPCDKQMLAAPVAAALKKGIPVVIIDSGLEATQAMKDSPKYLGYVATDNYLGGRKAAERMAELFQGRKAKVMMVRYQAGSESTEERERGFIDGIKKTDHLELFVPQTEAGATVDTAQKASESLLNDHKDLDGIFMPNESSVQGMLEALKARGQAGKIKLVGFDSNEVLLAALKRGDIDGLVLQDPFQMGYEAVKRAIAAADGKEADRGTLHTNLRVATRENVDSAPLRAMHTPDLERYLPK
jgi:ribose transport system substrate-binding protein